MGTPCWLCYDIHFFICFSREHCYLDAVPSTTTTNTRTTTKHASSKAGHRTRKNMTNASKNSNRDAPRKKCPNPSSTADGGSARGSKTVKARLPKGLRDIDESEAQAQGKMLRNMSKVCASWGFEALETPVLEYADALGKFLPDEERPNAGVFSLRDDDEQWLALRYDLTAPLARYVAENHDSLPKPFRRYQYGMVFRNEKPDPGRFRQFMQFDVDIVGAPAPMADAELCALAAACMDASGLDLQCSLRVSNRKLLDGLLENIGMDRNTPGFAERRLRIFRAIDKKKRLGLKAVEELLGEGRKDVSGDFTQGAGLKPKDLKKVLDFTGLAPDLDHLENLMKGSSIGEQGVEELREMLDLIQAFKVSEPNVQIDTSIVRGLDYYTGPIFEIDSDARPNGAASDSESDEAPSDFDLARLGSLGGGGRYDGLISRFKGVEIPAAGFSVGVSRLYAALKEQRKLPSFSKKRELDVVILQMDPAGRQEAALMARELRHEKIQGLLWGETEERNISAEVYLGSSGMRAQMRYADRRGARIAIIQGERERKNNEVTIRNMLLGKTLSGEIKDASAWKEGGEAQHTIPRNQLVAEVRKILDPRNK